MRHRDSRVFSLAPCMASVAHRARFPKARHSVSKAVMWRDHSPLAPRMWMFATLNSTTGRGASGTMAPVPITSSAMFSHVALHQHAKHRVGRCRRCLQSGRLLAAGRPVGVRHRLPVHAGKRRTPAQSCASGHDGRPVQLLETHDGLTQKWSSSTPAAAPMPTPGSTATCSPTAGLRTRIRHSPEWVSRLASSTAFFLVIQEVRSSIPLIERHRVWRPPDTVPFSVRRSSHSLRLLRSGPQIGGVEGRLIAVNLVRESRTFASVPSHVIRNRSVHNVFNVTRCREGSKHPFGIGSVRVV